MSTIPPPMLIIWAVLGVIQLRVLFLVITRRHLDGLPFFASYVGLNLCQSAFLVVVYSRFGFNSPASFRGYWISESIVLLAKSLAAIELIHQVLRHYRGIWGLAWRLFATAVFIVSTYAWNSARQETEWGLLIANRGYHLTFVVAIVSCLLLIRFYSIPVDPVYKTLLAGFCFYSCVVVAANSALQTMFSHRFPDYAAIWNYGQLLAFGAVQAVWALALRHPVAAADKEPGLLPVSTYQRISPEVNFRLRLINDALGKFWRVEAPRP